MATCFYQDPDRANANILVRIDCALDYQPGWLVPNAIFSYETEPPTLVSFFALGIISRHRMADALGLPDFIIYRDRISQRNVLGEYVLTSFI